jgi:hypothetical protein
MKSVVHLRSVLQPIAIWVTWWCLLDPFDVYKWQNSESKLLQSVIHKNISKKTPTVHPSASLESLDHCCVPITTGSFSAVGGIHGAVLAQPWDMGCLGSLVCACRVTRLAL